MKPTVAIVRGKFLNRYEMQFFEPLIDRFAITAFGSSKPYHSTFSFPVIPSWSPMDLPDIPLKMSMLNRICIDAHYLLGLEEKLHGFDIVHTAETYYHYTQQCLDAKKRGKVKKVVATVLENIPFNNEGIRGRKEFKLRAREELDHIIALTERTKIALLLEGAEEKKISVIGHFIDTKRFTQKIRNHTQTVRILFCGRLEKYKGVYEILHAAKILLLDPELRTCGLQFSFVGDGSEKNRMLEMEQQLGIAQSVFHTTASYDEMPKQYNDADIYVAPSTATETWQEQYNTTLLEAQASGLAIVTTASGGIVENVGDAALLVQPADVVSLVAALKKFILSKQVRDEYGKKARMRAETVHDISIGAKKIEAVYRNLL